MTTAKGIKGTNWLVILALFIILFFCVLISFMVYSQIRNDLYKNKEASAVSSGKVLNHYIIDTYELYFNSGTLKFQEVMNHINDINSDFSSFQVIAVDGNVLFDSQFKDFNSNEETKKSDLGSTILGSTEVYTQKTGNRVNYIVAPHIDDWGNHKYSVRYLVNYQDVNEKLDKFKIIFTTVTGAIAVGLISIFIVLIYGEKYKLEKQHTKDLDSINRAKDEFMVLVSHNLRTPLTVIKGYMSFISDPTSPKNELKEDISDMEAGVQRLSSLVEDIVLTTSILSGEEKFVNEEVNLEKIIGEIRLKYDDQIRAKNLKFHYTFEGETTFVGDKKAIGKIFDNLIDNAVKFDMENGSVDVKIENGPKLKILVSDTGAGIESAKLDNIVGFFHRGSDILNYNFEGEGLGLYLTNLIVKHYNGQMHVTSEQDKGSTFEVVLKKEKK